MPTLNANWIRAMEKTGIEFRHVVKLTVDPSTVFYLTDGTTPGLTDVSPVYPSIDNVKTADRAIDPLWRNVSVGQISLTLLLDEFVKDLLVDHVVIGARVELRIGEASLLFSDYVPSFTGWVESIDGPTNTSVTLKVKTIDFKLDDQESSYLYFSGHPLQFIEKALKEAGLNSTDHYDATSVDPSQAVYADVGHFVVNRVGFADYHDERTPEKLRCKDVVEELSLHIVGSMIPDVVTGKLAFTRYDPTVAVSDNWTDDDMDEFEILGLYDNLKTGIHIKSHPIPKWVVALLVRDTDAETRFGLQSSAGTQPNKTQHVMESEWIDGVARAAWVLNGDPIVSWTPTFPAPTEQFGAFKALISSFCGTNGAVFASPSPWAQLNGTTRTGTILVKQDPSLAIAPAEFIEVDQFIGGGVGQRTIFDPSPNLSASVTDSAEEAIGNQFVRVGVVTSGTFRMKTRGVRGTSPGSFALTGKKYPHLYDVTIQWHVADLLLPRFANGAPEIEITTGPSKFGLDIGALITLTTDRFFAFGKNGLTSSTIWEITGKKTEFHEEVPSIRWTVVFVKDITPPSFTLDRQSVSKGSQSVSGQLAALQNRNGGLDPIMNASVLDGLTVAINSGLVGTVSAGRVTSGYGYGFYPQDVDITFLASKDTYLTFDPENGTLNRLVVNNGGPDPIDERFAGEARIAKVVTDGSAITSIIDQRGFGLIPSISMDGDARNQHGVYTEHFERFDEDRFYREGGATDTGTPSLVATGQAGDGAVEMDGPMWLVASGKVQFDPSKLYRLRVRLRITQRDGGPDTTKEDFSCGIQGWKDVQGMTRVDRQGNETLSDPSWVAAKDAAPFTDFGLSTYGEYTGWFKGTSATGSAGPNNDATVPATLHQDTKYFSVAFRGNFGTGSTAKTEVDYVAVDVFDEDSTDRTYNAVKDAAAAYVINTDKVINDSVQDDKIGYRKIIRSETEFGGAAINVNAAMSMFSKG